MCVLVGRDETHSVGGTGSTVGQETTEGGHQKLVLSWDGRFLNRWRSNWGWQLSGTYVDESGEEHVHMRV